MALPDIDEAAILTTLQEFNELGRGEFLRRYGFAEETDYLLRVDGSFYDPKAVVGAACRHTSHGAPLLSREFDSTEAIARLEALGFEVLSFNGIWWVNQGDSYKIERDGGFVWAPQRTKNGREVGHHKNVNNLRVGQRIIHYVDNYIRAVGTVAASPTARAQPEALRRDTWIDEGYLCPVDYRELTSPIHRNDIPGRIAPNGTGPFDVNGNVKFGYLFPVLPDYLFTLLEFLEARIPDFFGHQVTHPAFVDDKEVGLFSTDERDNPIVDALLSFKNVVLEGVPGTGKSYAVQQVADDWPSVTGRELVDFDGAKFRAIVLHPSSSYEDFVEGLRPAISRSAGAARPYFDEAPQTGNGFGIVDGFFLSVCAAAVAQPHKDVLVMLDELNRCNVPSVFGDLLLALEKSRRATYPAVGARAYAMPRPASEWEVVTPVSLPYSGRTFFVPDNVYVIATMNTTDRSVAPLDAALRRRFAFHRLEPAMPEASCLKDTVPTTTRDQFNRSSQLLRDLNDNALRPCLGPDAMIGHSYLYAVADNLNAAADVSGGVVELKSQWRYAILPQLIDAVRAFGAEDLLSAGTRATWLTRHADANRISETARLALESLDQFLQNSMDLRIVVEGSGLARGARIEEHATEPAEPDVE